MAKRNLKLESPDRAIRLLYENISLKGTLKAGTKTLASNPADEYMLLMSISCSEE